MSRNDPSAAPPPDSDDREPRDALARLLGPETPTPDVASLYAGLQAEIARERGARAWLRSRSTPVRAAIAGTGLLLGALGLGLLWLRPDAGQYPAARMATIVLFSTALISAQLWLVLRPLQQPALAAWVARGLALGACGGLFALYVLPTAHAAHPDSLQPAGGAALLGYALPCLVVGSAVAGAGYALLRALDRGGASRALLAAVCGGVSANLLLQLHCPNTAPAHLILGHLGALFVVAGAVALRAWRAN